MLWTAHLQAGKIRDDFFNQEPGKLLATGKGMKLTFLISAKRKKMEIERRSDLAQCTESKIRDFQIPFAV